MGSGSTFVTAPVRASLRAQWEHAHLRILTKRSIHIIGKIVKEAKRA